MSFIEETRLSERKWEILSNLTILCGYSLERAKYLYEDHRRGDLVQMPFIRAKYIITSILGTLILLDAIEDGEKVPERSLEYIHGNLFNTKYFDIVDTQEGYVDLVKKRFLSYMEDNHADWLIREGDTIKWNGPYKRKHDAHMAEVCKRREQI